MRTISIVDLPPEVLTLIFEQLEPVRECAVPVDRRQFLSQESLDKIHPSTTGSAREIPKLRLLCKGFAKAGRPLLCPHVVARFSKQGLKRLERLAELPDLASCVRKFSYLVPFFYVFGKTS